MITSYEINQALASMREAIARLYRCTRTARGMIRCGPSRELVLEAEREIDRLAAELRKFEDALDPTPWPIR